MKKIPVVLLAAMLCVCLFAGCSGNSAGSEDVSGEVAVEDVEDVELGLGKVTLANMMGKDAAEILAQLNGQSQFFLQILSEQVLPLSLHTQKLRITSLMFALCLQTAQRRISQILILQQRNLPFISALNKININLKTPDI